MATPILVQPIPDVQTNLGESVDFSLAPFFTLDETPVCGPPPEWDLITDGNTLGYADGLVFDCHANKGVYTHRYHGKQYELSNKCVAPGSCYSWYHLRDPQYDDLPAGGDRRSEGLFYNLSGMQFNRDYWFRCKVARGPDWVYIPDLPDGPNGFFEIVTQFHDKGITTSPPVALRTGLPPNQTIENPEARGKWTFNASKAGSGYIVLSDVVPGRFEEYILHIVPSTNGTGTIEFWWNGVNVFSKTNTSTHTSGSAPPYMSWGIYHGYDDPPWSDIPQETFIDRLTGWAGPDITYAEVSTYWENNP